MSPTVVKVDPDAWAYSFGGLFSQVLAPFFSRRENAHASVGSSRPSGAGGGDAVARFPSLPASAGDSCGVPLTMGPQVLSWVQ